MITKTKQNGLIAIQRLFLLDSSALDKSYTLSGDGHSPITLRCLPGVIPHIIKEVKERSGIPIFAGGLIRSVEDVEHALASRSNGSDYVEYELWQHYHQ